MARRVERPAIVSENVDLFIGRMLFSGAAVLVMSLVVVQAWRWLVR